MNDENLDEDLDFEYNPLEEYLLSQRQQETPPKRVASPSKVISPVRFSEEDPVLKDWDNLSTYDFFGGGEAENFFFPSVSGALTLSSQANATDDPTVVNNAANILRAKENAVPGGGSFTRKTSRFNSNVVEVDMSQRISSPPPRQQPPQPQQQQQQQQQQQTSFPPSLLSQRPQTEPQGTQRPPEKP